jgi:hypothetical protein
MVGIEAWDNNMQRDPSNDLITCAYTPVAILSSILIGGFVFICLVALARQKLGSAMPVAGSCSLAIARRVILNMILTDLRRMREMRRGIWDFCQFSGGRFLLRVLWGIVVLLVVMWTCLKRARSISEVIKNYPLSTPTVCFHPKSHGSFNHHHN